MEVQRSSDPGTRGFPGDTLDSLEIHEMPQNLRVGLNFHAAREPLLSSSTQNPFKKRSLSSCLWQKLRGMVIKNTSSGAGLTGCKVFSAPR